MNETNELWRQYKARVVPPMIAKRLAQSEEARASLPITVTVLEPVAHHWRCTITSGDAAGMTFDYWPTRKTVGFQRQWFRGYRLDDALKLVRRLAAGAKRPPLNHRSWDGAA